MMMTPTLFVSIQLAQGLKRRARTTAPVKFSPRELSRRIGGTVYFFLFFGLGRCGCRVGVQHSTEKDNEARALLLTRG